MEPPPQRRQCLSKGVQEHQDELVQGVLEAERVIKDMRHCDEQNSKILQGPVHYKRRGIAII